MVKVGDEIEVKILRVDADERKIGLSRKRVDWAEEDDAADGRQRRRHAGLDASRVELKGGVGGGESGPLFKAATAAEAERRGISRTIPAISAMSASGLDAPGASSCARIQGLADDPRGPVRRTAGTPRTSGALPRTAGKCRRQQPRVDSACTASHSRPPTRWSRQ